jgi:glycosyltransferase involved in cell wall biosynthesis
LPSKIVIVTDAWAPQVNGVVRCLTAVGEELAGRQMEVFYLTPSQFWTVPLPTYPEIQLALATQKAVAAYFERVQPDHIHIATEGPLGLQARLYCEWNKVAFTSSYHTRFPEYLAARVPIPTEVSYAYLRWFHAEAAVTMVPTESVGQVLMGQGFSNLAVWSRGVDVSAFYPGSKSLFGDLPGPHLLYVGRVAVEKNVEAFLRLTVPGSKIVVGDGPQLEELRKKYPKAHFVGRKLDADLRAHYQSADVLVFPSMTDTFGNVMIEALACGTPVAAFPVTGPVDVLSDPKAGILDADLNVATRKALLLKRDDALAHAQRFTWTYTTDQFESWLVPTQPKARRRLTAA